jgi:hypothetical protein
VDNSKEFPSEQTIQQAITQYVDDILLIIKNIIVGIIENVLCECYYHPYREIEDRRWIGDQLD